MKSIIDVSSVVYAGHAGRPDMQFQGFPIGGLNKILRLIYSELFNGSVALCFDGGNILKKELLPTYKAERIPDYSVMAQIDVLKEILTGCNIPFYFDPKYEADDFVYSVVNQCTCLGDKSEIRVYSDDRDISCCVKPNCSVYPVSSHGTIINMSNYSEHVVRDRSIPYNSILLWKIFHGDASDKYKGITIPGVNFDTFAHDYIAEVSPFIENGSFPDTYYAEYEVLEAFVSSYNGLSSEGAKKTFLEQGRIVFPYKLETLTSSMDDVVADLQKGMTVLQAEQKHMKFFDSSSIDGARFEFVTSMLNHRGKLMRRHHKYNEDDAEGDEVRKFFSLRAKDLSSGVFAAERYKNRQAIMPQTEVLKNMDLPI